MGASEASWEAFGGFWGLWGRLWVLRGRLREALGCFQSISERLLGAPGTPWGASWGAFGTSWEAFWGSERALGAEKTQKWKSSFYLRNSLVFEVPVAPKASQNRPGVASRGLVERAEVASSVFGRVASRQSGSEAAELSGTRRKSAEPGENQRKPAEISRNSRRVKAISLSNWL